MNTTLKLTALAVLAMFGAAFFMDMPEPIEVPQPTAAQQVGFSLDALDRPQMVQTQPVPAPTGAPVHWVYRVDEIQGLVMKWLAFITAVALAALAAAGTIWARLNELKERQNRQSAKTGSLETRMTALAMATPGADKSIQATVVAAGDIQPTDGPQRGPAGGAIVGLVALLMVASACTLTTAQKQQWAQTGSFLASKAASLTTSIVLNAAVNSLDLENRADFGQGLGDGLRTLQGAQVTGADIQTLVAIWTPKKPEWRELGTQLGETFEQVRTGDPAKDAQALEALATGVQEASMEASAR